MKSKKGETFKAFISALESLGYRIAWKILNAANYGAATTRERLFIQARRGRKPIAWPNASHSKLGGKTLFGRTKKWRPAREIIEWETPSKSIFGRKRPLAPATMARIIAGLEKFGGKEFEPFLVILRNHATAQSVDVPIPTLTAGGNHVGLAQPFILGHRQFDEACVDSIDRPLRTITAKGGGDFALVEPKPFIVGTGGPSSGKRPRSVDDPLATLLTENHKALVQPFLSAYRGSHEGKKDGNRRNHSIDRPLPTQDTSNRYALVNPFLMQLTHGGRVHDIERPIPTITTAHRGETGIVSPLIAKYYGTGQCRPVSEPLDTVTAKDRFGLVTPLIRELADGTHVALDIHFRMLKPSELARAMSFPDSYQFFGNREDVVKQIGNAVDVSQAEALCQAVLA